MIPPDQAEASTTAASSEDGSAETRLPYSDARAIFVIGDGNFSFTDALLNSLPRARDVYVVACTLSPKQADRKRIGHIRNRGGGVLKDGFDITKVSPAGLRARLKQDHPKGLPKNPFDYVIFNFPHTGERQSLVSKEQLMKSVESNRRLIVSFLEFITRCIDEVPSLLTNTVRVHVTVKTTYPYDLWKVQELRTERMRCIDVFPFPFSHFQTNGYNHETTKKLKIENICLRGSMTHEFVRDGSNSADQSEKHVVVEVRHFPQSRNRTHEGRGKKKRKQKKKMTSKGGIAPSPP